MCFVLVILLVCPLFMPLLAESNILTVENTVIISNETDKTFCRDFSKFLSRLSLEWIIVGEEIPEKVKDKTIIILGGPDAESVGDAVAKMMSEEEMDYLRTDGNYLIREKVNPWSDNSIYICAGSDRLYTKRAAEEGIASLIMDAEDPEAWVNFFPATSSGETQQNMTRYQFIPQDEELPRNELAADFDLEPPQLISSEEAIEDIEYLFNLLSHGYSGYGYFRTKGNFDHAKKDIVEKVKTRPVWSPSELSEVIRNHLDFIRDGHVRIGDYYYSTHKDFWYNTSLEIWKTEGDSFFTDGTALWKILTVNRNSPTLYTYPSLDDEGEPVYILGVLSQSPPQPLIVYATNGPEEKSFEVHLYRSDSDFESEDIFSDTVIDGIPVISVRSFTHHDFTELEKFLKTAEKYRGEPVVILDIRGNGGGSFDWGETWVQNFTGKSPPFYFVSYVFFSRTSMMGQYNLFRGLSDKYPDTDPYRSAAEYFEKMVDSFKEASRKPYWAKNLMQSDIKVIPNATVIVVIIDDEVASAGETFIGNLLQVENVILVGENSQGTATFWNKGIFQLPHSLIPVCLSTTLNFTFDSKTIEEEGFFPDLWIPAEYSLDYVLRALEKQTITGAPSAHIFLKRGLEKKEQGELREALQDFTVAYSWFKRAGYESAHSLYKSDTETITFLDLEKEIVFLCLHFVREGDNAFKTGCYEDALENFAVVNEYWKTFYTISAFFVYSKEYKSYADIGEIYTPWIVEENI